MAIALKKIHPRQFYGNYYGHTLHHLKAIHRGESSYSKRHRIYLAGDSVLDNKYWILNEKANANNGYQDLLDPPICVPDVAYQMNTLLSKQESNSILNRHSYVVINTAVEEATIDEKQTKLNDQDLFIRDHLTENDYLVISLGGNDIALRPTYGTLFNMLLVTRFNSTAQLLDPVRSPWGLRYFSNLFYHGISNYIKQLTSLRKPKGILITTLYHLDENGRGWADQTLEKVGYNQNPQHLQAFLHRLTEDLALRFNHQSVGVPVKVVPLSKALDGKTTEDYVQRVEPSVSGGAKIAQLLLKELGFSKAE